MERRDSGGMGADGWRWSVPPAARHMGRPQVCPHPPPPPRLTPHAPPPRPPPRRGELVLGDVSVSVVAPSGKAVHTVPGQFPKAVLSKTELPAKHTLEVCV
jgi:hypothetical protein